MQQFDVVIVGGAITGSVLALALSSQTAHQIRIAVVEKSLPNYAEQGGFDARSIALAHGSLQKIAQIRPLAGGDLAQTVQQIAAPIEQIHVSDQGHFGKTCLSAEELGLPQLGAVVELERLGKRLAESLSAQPNIQLFCPDSVAKIERNQTACRLLLTSGTELECRLLVAADGMPSNIAAMCGVKTEQLRDYGQSAIIANVELSEPHNGRAFERFTAQGPFALLPLAGNRMSLVWCVREAEPLLALSDEAFCHALQAQFGWKLGKFLKVSKRFVYPLFLQKAETHTHHRLAIVGNAAQFLHPVAGQGFNLGMRDLFELSGQVSHAFNQGQDIGEYGVLSEFERHRQADQEKIIQATDGLISLFCNDFLPLAAIRNLGLIGTAHLAPVREKIANLALGW